MFIPTLKNPSKMTRRIGIQGILKWGKDKYNSSHLKKLGFFESIKYLIIVKNTLI